MRVSFTMLRHSFLLLPLLLLGLNAYAQPVNDACAGATNLGNLPQAVCNAPNGISLGTAVNQAGTNVNATSEFPFTTLNNCGLVPGNNMANPSLDVWYVMTLGGNNDIIQVTYTSAQLPGASMALYSGTCGNLVGIGCQTTAVGNMIGSFEGLSPGTYYLQVTGNSPVAQGTFNLSVQAGENCESCLQNAVLTVNPPPANGFYQQNQTVEFCISITDYNQVSANWFHGIEIDNLGTAWAANSINPTVIPPSCDGNGNWDFYNSCTSSATGTVFSRGFYYDSSSGGPLDGNPGNNYGDNCNANTWQFCWEMTTIGCPPGVNGQFAGFSLNTLGDGESGSWSSIACTFDAEVLFNAEINCCAPPQMAFTTGCLGNTATAQGFGTPPIIYEWSNGVIDTFAVASPSTITGIAPGNYQVTVTELGGCVTTANVTVPNTPGLTITPTVTNTTCVACIGAIDISNITGGTGPFTYAWTGGLAGVNPTGLCVGNYSVTATDVNGCTGTTTINITTGGGFTTTASGTNPTGLGFTDGTVTANPVGGAAPLTYAWENAANPGVSVGTTSTVTGLGDGTYNLTVTDVNGCEAVASVTIIFSPSNIVLVLTPTDPLCFGGADGSITLTFNGQIGAVSFVWENAANPGVIISTGQNLNGIPAGIYNVTLTDAAAQQAFGQAVVTEPTQISAGTLLQDSVSCNGGADGTASVSPSGGTPAYSFLWGANANNQTTPTATGLGVGTYVVTITDANGCNTLAAIQVFEPDAIFVGVTGINPLCNGLASGTAFINNVGGGTPIPVNSYNFTWSNGQAGIGLDTIFNLAGNATYTVTVTDLNGCSASASTSIGQPPALNVNIPLANVIDVTCFGICDGRATVTVSGGNPGYTFLWDNGQTTIQATGLCAGPHSVTVTDANACTAVANVTINGPTAVDATATITSNYNGAQITCFGAATGEASAAAIGGVGGYTFSWSNGANGALATGLVAGTYVVLVEDTNGCQDTASVTLVNPTLLTATVGVVDSISCAGISDGSVMANPAGGTGAYNYLWSANAQNQVTQMASGLGAGNFFVTVSDVNGCTVSASGTLVSPPVLTATASVISDYNGVDISCINSADGTVTASAVGGVPNYLYDWGFGPSTDPNLPGQPDGFYSVVVTDANGCSASANTIIIAPNPLVIATTIDTTSCFGVCDGGATILAQGGTPINGATYTYLWSDGQTTSSATNLCAGVYGFTVTDWNGCTFVGVVSVPQPQALTAVTTLDNTVLCFGQSNGVATAFPDAGNAPYTYLWDNNETTQTATQLSAGIHRVTITDANGCTAQTQVNMVEPPALLPIQIIPLDVPCYSEPTGGVTFIMGGGTGAGSYTYAWADSNLVALPFTGNSISGVNSGLYYLTVTDANACTFSTPFNVNEAAQDTLMIDSIDVVDAGCFGAGNGTATAFASGGIVGTYSFEWSNDSIGVTINGLSLGSYSVTVTDINGCIDTANFFVNQPDSVILVMDTVIDATCFGFDDGVILVDTAATAGGTAPYIYSLDGDTYVPNDGIFTSVPGREYYTIFIQDANGCTDTAQVFVDGYPELVVYVGEDVEIALGDSVDVETEDNTSIPLTYVWTMVATPTDSTISCDTCADVTLRPYFTTLYTLTATDTNGCVASDEILVSIDPVRNIFIPNAFTPNGDFLNDVFMVYGGMGVAQVDLMQIYDRWGELVFQAQDIPPTRTEFGWDGSMKDDRMNAGTFIYYIEVSFMDGQVYRYKGDVTLIR